MVLRRPNAQKWRICAEVKGLASALDRPVCSADLRLRFREFPERAPLLLQRLGLVLAKAARERPVRGIWPIGRVGFYAYYAPNSDVEWKAKLRRHQLRLAVLARISEDFPGYVMKLFGTQHERLASNALAGYVAECSALASNRLLEGWEPLQELLPLVNESRGHAASRFVARTPRDLMSRTEADKLLQTEYRKRMDPEAVLSVKRHLAILRWPQTSVLPARAGQRFCRRQLQFYAAGHWPFDVDEGETATAVWMALRYGDSAASGHHSRK
jgi:hypothetical protein